MTMLWRMPRSFGLMVLLLATYWIGDRALAAESLKLSTEEAACLLKYEERYRNAKLDPLILVPSNCPEIKFEDMDLTMLLQASSEPTEAGGGFFLLTAEQVGCLYEQLKLIVPSPDELGAANEKYTVNLDCD